MHPSCFICQAGCSSQASLLVKIERGRWSSSWSAICRFIAYPTPSSSASQAGVCLLLSSWRWLETSPLQVCLQFGEAIQKNREGSLQFPFFLRFQDQLFQFKVSFTASGGGDVGGHLWSPALAEVYRLFTLPQSEDLDELLAVLDGSPSAKASDAFHCGCNETSPGWAKPMRFSVSTSWSRSCSSGLFLVSL